MTLNSESLFEAIELIKRHWSLPVLCALRAAPRRYTDLLEVKRHGARISSKELRSVLQAFQDLNMVTKSTSGRRAMYAVTPLGRDFLTALDPIAEWSERWLNEIKPRGAASRTSTQ